MIKVMIEQFRVDSKKLEKTRKGLRVGLYIGVEPQERNDKRMNDRLKIGQEVLIHGYIDEIRKDTIIIQNKGGYFGTIESEVAEMPNTNDVLDKIRAEIEQLTIVEGGDDYVRKMAELFSLKMKVLQIFDKYKSEIEPQAGSNECMFSDYPDMPYQFDNMTGSMNLR